MYSSKRRCPPEYEEEFEDILKELVNSFTESWLNSNEGHEIQTLWQRNDMVASNELITLGESIKKLREINPNWINGQIRLIKNNEPNIRRGPIYEIILAAALHGVNGQTVDLLPLHTETYDLILNLSDGAKICFSIKNFGPSDKARSIAKEVRIIENVIIANPVHPPMSFFINKNEGYPSSEDWISLRRYLLHIMREKHDSSENYAYKYKIGKWDIVLKPINVENLFDGKTSYTLHLTAPFHKNEERRLYTNLHKASKALGKGYPETDQSINVLYAHIPYSVSMENYAKWSHNYLNKYPTSPISGIMLFQPAIAYNDKGESFIALSHKHIFRSETTAKWFKKNTRDFQLNFPVGIPTEDSYRMFIKFDNEYITTNNHYLYQSGHVYLYYDSDELLKKQKRVEMKMEYKLGIQTHIMFKLGGQIGELSGNFQLKDELLLL